MIFDNNTIYVKSTYTMSPQFLPVGKLRATVVVVVVYSPRRKIVMLGNVSFVRHYLAVFLCRFQSCTCS